MFPGVHGGVGVVVAELKQDLVPAQYIARQPGRRDVVRCEVGATFAVREAAGIGQHRGRPECLEGQVVGFSLARSQLGHETLAAPQRRLQVLEYCGEVRHRHCRS